jgi:ABC-2 type transport system permease protein
MSATAAPPPVPSPLRLLVRTNALQSWRRLKSVQEQSRLLTGFIGLFLLGYLGCSFGLFYKGIQFLATFPGLGEVLIERMLFLLFAFLLLMLLFSNLVIGYTNLFRNRETAFLLTLPVPAQTIFRWKFVETAVLASWAFLFLAAPLLVAYGLTRQAPWHFYPVIGLLLGLFIILPTVAGAWVAINIARFLDRRSFQVTLIGIALLGLAWAVWLKPAVVPEDLTDTRVLGLLDRLLVRTRFAQYPLLPSYWVSSTVMQWQDGAITAAVFFILVLLSHVLFFGLLAFTRTGRSFYEAVSAVQSRGSVLGHWGWFRSWQSRQRQFTYPRGLVEVVFGWLPEISPDVRALLVKDVRMFWRDTTQWGQTLMLFGLLGVYIVNLRHFSQQLTNPFWVNLISLLNLLACSLNLATLTTRFVYPQFSLEGKRIWIVGLAPLGLVRVVRAKFWLASTFSMLVTLTLMWLSCHLLRLPWERTLYFTGAVVVMALTLNGLAVGLGVLYPNLREDNPSKIVSGFGGTLCLVLSFLYILGSIVILGFGSPWSRLNRASLGLTSASWLTFCTLSAVLGWLPYQLGLRRVARFEV